MRRRTSVVPASSRARRVGKSLLVPSLLFIAAFTAAPGPATTAPLAPAAAAAPPPAPSAPAFDAKHMNRADQLIEEAVKAGQVPGAVLLVGRRGGVVYRKAYGNRAIQPAPEPMTEDTVFDLASLSKPVGCATSVMLLVERGRVQPGDRVAKYLPAFAANGKEHVTVEQLLLHRGGLIPDNSLDDYDKGPAESWKNINRLKPQSKPGTQFAYTDVGYMVLGELVRAVDGRPLDQFAKEEVFGPLGMVDTTYNPPAGLKPRCAPTEKRNGAWMRGEVHDPRAYALGGVAGHAGVFGTADDLARYCRMILGGGEVDGRRILKKETVDEMTRPRGALPDGSGNRSYGFDVDTGYSSARGDRFEPGASFGHTGFTGTMFWMDPANDCFVILLTNSVHPDGRGRVIELRKKVSTAAAEAMLGVRVLCGIDMLARDGFKALEGKRVAVVTNHTGRDRNGGRTISLLAAAKNLKLVKIFSPEHGLFGVLDEKVGHTVDPETGLKVYSLYGDTRKPTPEMLDGVDAIVYDIQDVGTRFYTYISTLGLCMEAAAERKIKVFVLDRPNPITGLSVDGPTAEPKHFGFTAYGPIPLVHGMTVGELAKLFNAEFKVNCDLTVVEMRSWRRPMWWDETGLMWVNPSPNMRNATQALVYPAVGVLEAANLSVGRGTDQPFEVLGAPWVDGRRLAAALNGSGLPGLRFVPISFTPQSSKFAGQTCEGVYLIVTDRKAFEPARSGLTIAWHLRRLFGDAFEVDGVGRLLHNDAALEALKKADDPATLPAMWATSVEEFKNVRQKYLIYPE
jgi:uncharacterized protein YbbC (DUF1343 family)/CubicO group peptidase (beta-lactamase class C family)